MALPPEVEASYSAIIDGILAKSDLHKVSAKQIRKGLQAQVSYDISSQKEDINALIMTRFDKFNTEASSAPAPAPAEPAPSVAAPPVPAPAPAPAPAPVITHALNGLSLPHNNYTVPPPKRPESSDAQLSSVDSSPPPKKKHKKSASIEEDDAAFAARLQAEENQRARSRSTRAGGAGSTRKARAPAKAGKAGKVKKKKSAKKVGSDDDSELDGSGDAEKKEVKRTGGFHKEMALSQPLAELLGETTTVKKIWEYVKRNGLQDPSDKRQIRCDDPMRAVFKQDRVHMFTMNKILNQNLYALDE